MEEPALCPGPGEHVSQINTLRNSANVDKALGEALAPADHSFPAEDGVAFFSVQNSSHLHSQGGRTCKAAKILELAEKFLV